jgi:DnaJ-class molecular chaperone
VCGLADSGDMTIASGPQSIQCPACAGKGWLLLTLDALPVPGWAEMLCRTCAGAGKSPASKSL